MSNRNNEPAFPVLTTKVSQVTGASRMVCEHEGLTKREYFAGQALAGMLANDKSISVFSVTKEAVAYRCYELADAMVEASKKFGEEPEDIGPQKQPASVNQIQAQVKAVQKELEP